LIELLAGAQKGEQATEREEMAYYYQISQRKNAFAEYTLLGYAYGNYIDIMTYFHQDGQELKLNDIPVTHLANSGPTEGPDSNKPQLCCIKKKGVSSFSPQVEGFVMGNLDHIRSIYQNTGTPGLPGLSNIVQKYEVIPLGLVEISQGELDKKEKINARIDELKKELKNIVAEYQSQIDNLFSGLVLLPGPPTNQDIFWGNKAPSKYTCHRCGETTTGRDDHWVDLDIQGGVYRCK
jgi:hypothetical protein